MYHISFTDANGKRRTVMAKEVAVTLVCPFCGREEERIDLGQENICIACEEQREQRINEAYFDIIRMHQENPALSLKDLMKKAAERFTSPYAEVRIAPSKTRGNTGII